MRQRANDLSRTGVFLALLSALMFATTVNIAPLAYAAGASVAMVLCFRLVFTAVVSTSLGWRTRPERSLVRQNRWLLFFLSVSLALQTMGYMTAVRYLPISVAVVIFYTFPIMTFVLSAVFTDRTLSLAPVLALGAALLGIWFLMRDGAGTWSGVGVFWAFIAALMQTAVNLLSQRARAFRGWQMVTYTTWLPALAFLGAYLVIGGSLTVETVGLCLLAAVAFCLGLYLFYRSIAAVGSVRTANMLYFEPVFTMTLGMFLFGDVLGPSQWLGVGMIVLATVVLELRARRKRAVEN